MRKTFIALALATATIATPAAAQWGQGYGQGYNQGYGNRGAAQIQREINQLEQRIVRSAQRGRLSRGEVISLRREANSLERDFYRFSRNGLDRGEYRNLQVRIERLQHRLREERRDGNRRGRGW